MTDKTRKLIVNSLIAFIIGFSIFCGGLAGYYIAIAEAYRHGAGDYVIVNSFGKVQFKWWDQIEEKEIEDLKIEDIETEEELELP